jgi:hypothetical protein
MGKNNVKIAYNIKERCVYNENKLPITGENDKHLL